MKKNYFVAILALICTFATAQIEQTSYRGAFAPAPTAMWTDGWANFDPQNAAYPAVNVTISSDITANTTWTTGNTYALSGLIYVRNNATLTIQPGVVIKGAGAGAALIVTKGAKLDAVGTATSPIVFTSNQPVGSRQKGDWGGIVLLGKASFNLNNGVNNIEGITATDDTQYGGGLTPDDNDNSGTLKYVRIEFCGYAYSPNNEINGLTMGAVGRGTTIDYVQVSHCNDDAFEWFGGTVNCKHLVSYRNLDDDFDTDNGYSGMVQYALAVRDPQVADAPAVSTSEGFESDNNASGTAVSPYTSAIFTNCTLIGPSYRVSTLPNGGPLATGYERAARIRRASKLNILNSIFMDFKKGIHIDGTLTENNAIAGDLKFKNNILAGITDQTNVTMVNGGSTFGIAAWFTANGNTNVATNAGILTAPYNTSDATVYTGLDYRPATGSIALSGSNFAGLIAAVPPTVVSPVAVCKGDKTTVLSATLAGGTSLKWYTAATGGKATTVAPKLATTTAGSTKSYWVSQVLPDGSESARAEIVVTVNDLPAKAGAITGNTKPSQFVGTTDELTYSIAEVAGATSYNWVAPLGMNIVSGQGTNEIIVDLNDVPAGAGIIGSLSVQAVNEAGCPSTAKVLKLTKVLPASPGTLSMTDGPASVTVEGVTTKAKAITTFGQFIGQDKELTLTAKPVVGATSYEWELPEGVNQVSGGTTNVITVNFAGVTPVTTTALYIGVKAKNGTGVSVTKNTTKVPETSSTAKLLLLKAAAPVSPSALKMFDDAISTTKAVTVISKYIGTATPLRLQAKPVATAYAYEWELPAGVTQLSGGTSNEITVDFAGVPAGTASLYIGVKAVNGVGVSTKSNATKVPATSSTATLLLLKATVPATVKAVTGQIVGLCGTYDYTITPTVLANGYTIVAPEGSVVTSASNPTNDSNVLTNTADLTFTVQYPDGMVADKLNPKTLTVISVNGVGNSLNGKVLKLSTELAAVGAPTGGTTFQRCSTMTFSVPAVAFATNYVWSATNGAVFVGDATSNSVEVDFSEVPAGLTKTTLSVQASTDCGYIGKAKVISLKSVACGTGRMAPAAVTAAVTSAEIYPNPAVDSFNLDITAERNGELTITICSFNGNEIYSRKVGLTEGLNTVTENISSLGKGIYFVKIYNSANNQTLVKKLVKN
ncbi:MAG: T9SS type A sorting domain-containing protein [Flavobacterium sp.]